MTLVTAILADSVAHRLRDRNGPPDVIVTVFNVEPKPTELLLHLGGDDLMLLVELLVTELRMLPSFPVNVALDVGAERLDDIVPAVAVGEAPAHAGDLHALVSIAKNLRILLAEHPIKLVPHRRLPSRNC